jgi:hypothetical protein
MPHYKEEVLEYYPDAKVVQGTATKKWYVVSNGSTSDVAEIEFLAEMANSEEAAWMAAYEGIPNEVLVSTSDDAAEPTRIEGEGLAEYILEHYHTRATAYAMARVDKMVENPQFKLVSRDDLIARLQCEWWRMLVGAMKREAVFMKCPVECEKSYSILINEDQRKALLWLISSTEAKALKGEGAPLEYWTSMLVDIEDEELKYPGTLHGFCL